ncbi:hypothetical protein HUJ05_004280 [Dendroctonus ponderosae]|nr:hypothetical protein HUJ05_004280 [Dendroctonus ponderosae]
MNVFNRNCQSATQMQCGYKFHSSVGTPRIAVGVTEELEDFIAVLETSLPRIFKGALEHYTGSNKSHLRQTVQKNSPSVETGREHPKMAHKDLPQALLLLSEMNVSAQHVASLVDNMIQKVRNGELSTDQGLSFLEVKYNMLLSYLINLTYVVLRKCSGEPIEGHPCIDRLIEIRTVLEKMRPIDHKLKYQIDKLVKNAVTGTSSDDPSTFKANPLNLATQEGYENSDSESSDESENGKTEKTKTGIYVPPKLSAVHYTETDSAQKKAKRLQEKNRKMMSSSIMHDIMDEYLDTPTEVSHEGSMNRAAISKEQKEREEYEEEYFTRLPLSKAEAKKSHSTIVTIEVVSQNEARPMKFSVGLTVSLGLETAVPSKVPGASGQDDLAISPALEENHFGPPISRMDT